MKASAYLHFPGNCREAMDFYAEATGGKIVQLMPHSTMPGSEAHLPPGWADKVMHSSLAIGDTFLMATDAPPQYYAKPQGFAVSLTLADVAEGERIFRALSKGAQAVSMDWQPTFWSPGFGMFTDKFGISWIVNCDPAG